MTKEQEFLQFVQTIIITNGINISLNEDAKENRHVFSATGVVGILFDAVDASKRIPQDMDSIKAAEEFCFYMLDNLKDNNDTVPRWFAKH
jgi:hypothetical protein